MNKRNSAKLTNKLTPNSTNVRKQRKIPQCFEQRRGAAELRSLERGNNKCTEIGNK